jgi:hypothetical protein
MWAECITVENFLISGIRILNFPVHVCPLSSGAEGSGECIEMLLYTLTTRVIKIFLYYFHTKRNNFNCYVHSTYSMCTGQYMEGFRSAHMCKVFSHLDPNPSPLCMTKLHLKNFSPSTTADGVPLSPHF